MSVTPDLTPTLLPLIGHHARNVQRGVTLPPSALIPELSLCQVCAGPVKGSYERCFKCNEQLRAHGASLADQVVPLSYAVKNSAPLAQFYSDLFSYKKEPNPSAPAQNRLAALLMLFTLHHRECLEEHSGLPVSSVVPVPSGRNRQNHPLPRIAHAVGAPVADCAFVGAPRSGRAGGISLTDFSIATALHGHVMVLEDTWVTGANAQSVAIAARTAGASSVSIVVLSRLLDYNFAPTDLLVDSWSPEARWSTMPCPVPGVSCR